MDSTVFCNINVYGCNLCHIRHNFPVVANIIICRMFCWFINNNLKISLGMNSCSISGIILGEPEKFLYNCYQFSCCAVRNSNVTAETVNSVFLVTAFPNFTCDIPFCVSDMIELN